MYLYGIIMNIKKFPFPSFVFWKGSEMTANSEVILVPRIWSLNTISHSKEPGLLREIAPSRPGPDVQELGTSGHTKKARKVSNTRWCERAQEPS